MEITVLGSVAASRDGADVAMGPSVRRLFARLVVDHGRVVSQDRLIDALWGDDLPGGADRSLKTYVSRLRAAIDPDGAGCLVHRDPGYLLLLNGSRLDSADFESRLDDARLSLRGLDPEQALAEVREALDSWGGDPFADLAEEEWAEAESVRLRERHVEAQELLIEALLATGDAEQAIAMAKALTVEAPLRERPRELLMRALYVTGRQPEALREFRSFRRMLAEDLGLDPSPHLIEVEGRVASGDDALRSAHQPVRGYEIKERVGSGAFAAVHRAVQPGIGRDVAIKIIRSPIADAPWFVRSFEHEARVIASVEHPHVVPLYDYWREPGAAFLVMRLMRGGNAGQRVHDHGPLSPRAVAEILRDVGPALTAAHRAGVVHRDIRPANVLLDEDGAAYLADFGIAFAGAPSAEFVSADTSYSAPEFVRGEPMGVAADVYGLALTVHELLSGRTPVDAGPDSTHPERPYAAPELGDIADVRDDVPPAIDDVLGRAAAADPDDRHRSVAELVSELMALLDSSAAQEDAMPSLGADVENPYVGLHAFEEGDSNRFYGRDALVADVVDRLEAQPFVVVVGASGSGKSSVVRAGVLPALRGETIPGSSEWFVTTMVPGHDPIESLEAALLRVAVNPPVSLRDQLAEPGGLLRAVRRVLPDDSTQLLVVIDQLEELFTLESSTDERERFLSELASAITAPGSPLRVIATLRADHYDGPLSNAAFAHLVSEGTVAVEPFTPAELEEAIVRPAESVGVQVEPALVAELVAAAGLRPASLPLLQFALTETFRRRPEAQLSLITYQELGGLTGALAVRADELIGAGDSVDRTEARRIFGRLVVIEPSGLPSRRRARLSELGTADRTASLIERLVAARLLTVDRDDTSREPTVEVAHEALLRDWPTLLNWINEDREQLRVVHAVNERARVWVEAERDPSELARGARLFSASELLGCRSDLLTADEVAWVEASQEQEDAAVAAREAQIEHEQHQNRRLRGLLAGAGVLLAVSLVAAGVAVWQRSESVDREAEARSAEDAARTAEQEAASAQSSAEESLRLAEGAERMADAARGDAEIERLVALASAEIESTPDRAALIALEANRRRDDAVTRSALQRTIATEPRLSRVISPGSPDADLWLATDGSTIVSASPDGLEWIDPTTGEPDGTAFAVEGLGGGSGQVLISETGLVAVTTERDEESMTTLLRRDGDSVQELGVRDAWAFSIGGDMVALSGDDAVVFVDPVAGVEVIWPVPSDWGIWTVVASGGARAVIAWRSSDPDGGPEIFGLDVVDLLSGEVVDSLARDRELTAMALSADGVLAAGYPNGDLVVRNVEDLEGSAIRRVAHGREVQAIGIGADGRISTGGADRSVHFWTADAERSGDGAGVRGANAQVAVDSGGRTLVWHDSTNVYIYGSSDRRIVDHRVDDPRPDWEEGPRVEQAPNEISRLVDGGRSLVLESFEGVERQTLDLAAAHDGVPVVDWSFSGDGQRVLSLDEGVVEGSGDGRWVVTSIDGTTISSWPDERVHAAIRDVGARSPFNWWMDETGERALFHGAGDAEGGFVFAIDTSTGALVDGPVSVPVPSSFGLRGEFLADGGIVLGGHGGELVVLDGDLTERMTIDGGAGLTPLDHDPSTGLVLLGGADGATVVLDSATGALRSLVGGVGNIALGAFSPDSSTVAVVSPDAGLILFDVGTGEILGVPMVPGGGAFGGGPGIHWESDGTGFWLHPGGGPVRFVTDPSRWRDIACEMAGRELTAEEWRTLISETEPQVASCTDTV